MARPFLGNAKKVFPVGFAVASMVSPELWEKILRAMNVEVVWKSLEPFLRLFLRVAFLPQVLLAFVVAVVLAALLIGVVAALHLLISLARKRQTRVFISFHHERESIANALATEMTKCRIRAAKLPFVGGADSDTLNDQVHQEIDDCDVFVCVPGNRQSFVDSEVSAARQVKKPILFVLIEADAPHLPDTAMKGSPVFALEELQREGFQTFANFCSYLAADSRSTARLYKAVFHHLLACVQLVGAVYIFLIVILTSVMYFSERLLGSSRTAVSNLAMVLFFGSSLILFLVPYGVFFTTRLDLQEQIRRVISGKKFSRDTFIPETLAYSLRRADLLKILYHGDIVTHHESLST